MLTQSTYEKCPKATFGSAEPHYSDSDTDVGVAVVCKRCENFYWTRREIDGSIYWSNDREEVEKFLLIYDVLNR